MKKILALALAVGMVMGFASMASANVTVGGDVRLETTWGFADEDYSLQNSGVDKSYVDVWQWDTSTSRLKFRWADASKKYGAYVEIGTYGNGLGGNVATRRVEFWYNWDGGQIWFGQGYANSEHYWPNQYLLSALSLIGYGKHYMGRYEQVNLTLGTKHKLKLALVSPRKNTSPWAGGRLYHNIPAIAAALHMNFGNVRLTPWVQYELVQWESTNDSDTFNSLDLGLRLAGDFGLVGFSVAVAYAINSAQSSPVVSSLPQMVNNNVSDDVTQFNIWAELRIGGLSLGGGYVAADRADWSNTPFRYGAYASYKIPFGPITFRPEIVYLNNGEDQTAAKIEQGGVVYVGLFTNLAF